MADIKIETRSPISEKQVWLSAYLASLNSGSSVSPALAAQDAVNDYLKACTKFKWLP